MQEKLKYICMKLHAFGKIAFSNFCLGGALVCRIDIINYTLVVISCKTQSLRGVKPIIFHIRLQATPAESLRISRIFCCNPTQTLNNSEGQNEKHIK